MREGNFHPHYDEVISRLVSEGYLEESKYGYNITHKGRTVMEEGGFLRQHRREMKGRRIAAIGVVSGVIAALVSVVALYLQCCR